MSTRDVTEPGVGARGRSLAERCPECDGPLRSEHGETYCADCGLVLAKDALDPGPEWRGFGEEAARKRRTGHPLTEVRHDRGLSAEIGFDTVAHGRTRGQLKRMRRQHNRARFGGKGERNLAAGLGGIARLVSALELPRSARERASVLFRQAQDEGFLVGRSVEIIAAASVYAACRCHGLTRSLDEVVAVARCSMAEIERGYRVLNRELGLSTRIQRPSEYLPKLASAVDAPDGVRRRAVELAEQAEAAGLANGRHPGGLAAGCVYRAGHDQGQLYTQAELAEVVDVTTATIQARLKELSERIE